MGDTFISDGSTRKRISPATAGLQREVKDLLEILKTSNENYDLIAGPDKCAVTTTSKTLHDLGVVIDPNIRRLTLVPYSVGIYWANGATATTSSAELPDASIEADISFAVANVLEFVVSSGTVSLTVIQEA